MAQPGELGLVAAAFGVAFKLLDAPSKLDQRLFKLALSGSHGAAS
jgi:hypothetical protein